jgi:hypothetical protein
MLPNVCRCVAMCCAYFEVWVLYRKDLTCSLYLVLKSRFFLTQNKQEFIFIIQIQTVCMYIYIY